MWAVKSFDAKWWAAATFSVPQAGDGCPSPVQGILVGKRGYIGRLKRGYSQRVSSDGEVNPRSTRGAWRT